MFNLVNDPLPVIHIWLLAETTLEPEAVYPIGEPSVRIHKPIMRAASVNLRYAKSAILVLATLLSLCISKNVGPQFFPWPDLSPPVEVNNVVSQADTAKGSSSELFYFRVPFVVQAQKRSVIELHSQHIAASQLRSVDEAPIDVCLFHESTAPVLYRTAAVAGQQHGRAPPLSLA